MKDLSLPEIESDWNVSNGLHTSYFSRSEPPLKLISSPSEVELDIYPLSPILFEESSLDRLWKDEPPSRLPPISTPSSLSGVRSLSGLKSLSWRVKELVEERGSSTYQEITDQLMKELQITQKKSPQKSEKNVRRRIYDALNVLVAVNVLEKQGKYVTSNRIFHVGLSSASDCDELTDKRDKLSRLVEKYCAIRNLYERNTMQSRVSQTVPYPLVVVPIPKNSLYDVRFT